MDFLEENKDMRFSAASVFAYLQGKDSFEIKKYVKSLSVDNLLRWNIENMLPNTLLTMYQRNCIDIGELKSTEGLIVAEPLGELDSTI